MLKERSQTLKLGFVALDFILSAGSFAIAFFFRYLQDEVFYYTIKNYVILGCLLSITQVIAFISINLYHPRRSAAFFNEFRAIVVGVILNLLIILSILFFFRGEIRGENYSRLVVANYILINIFLTSIIHFLFRRILMILREKGYNLRKVIIIGTGNNAERVTNIFRKHKIYGYVIAGFIKVFSGSKAEEGMNVLGTVNELEKVLQENKPDLVIHAKEYSDQDDLREILDVCDNEGIELKIIPGYIDFITAKGRVEDLDGLPIITIRDIPIRLGYNRVMKRVMDVLVSLAFILLFSPFYILIALIVKLTSEGDIFIKQERVGLDNKSFMMLKFRTMYTQSKDQSDTVWTTKNDPRVTPIGSILRKLSLDETPQFFNVLIGNMSVVGPRPERPFFVEKFKTTHKQYMRRHAVKAGITGWAQINGLRGDTSIEKRIEADIYYIENWSLLFDLKIIFLTPLTGLINKNAY